MAAASGSYEAMLAVVFFWGLANHFGLNVLIMRLTALDPIRRGAIMGLNSGVTYLALFGGTIGFGAIYAGKRLHYPAAGGGRIDADGGNFRGPCVAVDALHQAGMIDRPIGRRVGDLGSDAISFATGGKWAAVLLVSAQCTQLAVAGNFDTGAT